MFTPTLNRLAVSAHYVSSTPVGQATCKPRIRQEEAKKTENRDAFSEVEHKHNNPVASLEYARVSKSIIYVTKSTHQQAVPQKNTQNTG